MDGAVVRSKGHEKVVVVESQKAEPRSFHMRLSITILALLDYGISGSHNVGGWKAESSNLNERTCGKVRLIHLGGAMYRCEP